MYLCLWMIAHMFGADGSAMLSARASLVRLVVHRSSVCSCIARLPFVCRYSARASVVHRSSACSSAARLSARRCPVVGLPLICHACIARLSPRLSAGLPLSCRWYIAALSARVVVAALSAALPLVLPLLCLFVRRWSLTGPSLVCLLVSLCSVTDPSLPCLLGSWSLTCLLVSYLSLLCRCSVAPLPDRPSGRASLVCRSTAPLGCSTRLLDSTRLLYSTPLDSPCVHSYSICWLSLAATLFTHTLFHAWCPVTLLSLIRCSTVVVTAAASCGRARDSIARCVVAARLPPSATSVTVPTDCSFLAVQRLNAVQCTALHSIAQHCTAVHSSAQQCTAVHSSAQQHTRAFKRWFLCRSLVLLESFEHRSGS